MSSVIALALSTKGFGETILGLQIADALRREGHDLRFVSHPSTGELIRAAGFAVETFSEQVGAFLPVVLGEVARQARPDALLLADYFTTDLWLAQNGLGPDVLTDLRLPITAIDTWHMERSGDAIDIYWQRTRKVRSWLDRVANVVRPVPIASPDAGGAYSCLPEGLKPQPRAVSEEIRNAFSIGQGERLVLFCTAQWQQTQYICPHAQRIAAALPHLIAGYIRALGPRVKLVHVGPASYELDLAGQYFWVDQLSQDRFARLLGAADLLLTMNVSSTTIARAMAMDLPVAALVNSHDIGGPEDVAALPFQPLAPAVAAWLTANTPVFSYLMWPVGYRKFLAPLIPFNPFFDTLAMAEVFHERAVMATLEGLLFDRPTRHGKIEAQRRYLRLVRDLPSALDALAVTA